MAEWWLRDEVVNFPNVHLIVGRKIVTSSDRLMTHNSRLMTWDIFTILCFDKFAQLRGTLHSTRKYFYPELFILCNVQ